MTKASFLDNAEINEKEGYALMRLNPEIYPLEVIYLAAYVMIEKAYILLDGNPKEKIFVEIRPKMPNQDLNELLIAFNDELLNYAVYKVQSEKNKTLREVLLQRALLTNDPNYFTPPEKEQKEDEKIDDSEGIAKTWDEKCDGAENGDNAKTE